jgi:hypothetical protein
MPISKATRKKWDDRVGFLLRYQEHLSDWELGFLDSIDALRSAGKDLSFKQSNKLREIAQRVEAKVG